MAYLKYPLKYSKKINKKSASIYFSVALFTAKAAKNGQTWPKGSFKWQKPPKILDFMDNSWKNGLILRNILKMIENWPKLLKLILGPSKKSIFRWPWASTLVSWPTFHIMIKRYHLPKKDQQEGHLPYRDPIGILNLDSQISLQKYKFSFSFFWIPKFREGRWIKPPQPPL